jgi:methylphosphotriester-DNA--protein-cysteine methyltransferase
LRDFDAYLIERLKKLLRSGEGYTDLTYKSYTPSPPLNAYIDDLYYLEGAAPYLRQKVLPNPTLHLMVNLGHAFQVCESDQTQPGMACDESWWVGLWNKYHIVEWPSSVAFYGVHFKPAGVYPFLQFPLCELHNQVVPMDVIWGRFAAEIRERLYDAPTAEAGFACLEQLLLSRLGDSPYNLKIVQSSIAEIAQQHGVLSIRTLSDQIGISQNHLLTQFKRLVGIAPKELARIYRFAHVLHSINSTQPADWSQIAQQAGFYDQAHFIKDFVAFTEDNPSDYLRLRRRFHTEKPQQAQFLGNVPVD